MRILTLQVAVLALFAVSFKSHADSVEFKDEATFSLRRATGYQREIVIVFPARDAVPETTLPSGGKSLAHVSFVVLEDACGGEKAMSSDDPQNAPESDASALRRRKQEAACDAGLKKLDVTAQQRKFTRVTAMAFAGSCVDAMTLFAAGKIDCDQLILINPVIEDLPTIPESHKPRGIDAVLPWRSDTEAVRSHAEILGRFGPWGSTARIFIGGGELDLLQMYALFRGYDVRNTNPPVRDNKPGSIDFGGHTADEQMRSAVLWADVVFAGELHGNPAAHALELDLLEVMGKAGERKFALSTEQFERDTQAKLDAFLALDLGKLDAASLAKAEEDYMKQTRAWPNYADYRSLLEFCRSNKRSVIAGNVPRRLAARINKEGPEVFEKFSAEDKAWCAKNLNTPDGAYKDKFFEVMGSSTGAKKDDKYAALERMYAAQCLKDDTMAESIVTWLDANKGGKVLHINGAFHSAGGLGIPEKLKAMRPGLKIVVITCIEADNPFTAELSPEDAKGNDFVVFVPGSRPNRKPEAGVHPK